MSLAVVRSIDSPRRLSTADEVEGFELEMVGQYALAIVAAGRAIAMCRRRGR